MYKTIRRCKKNNCITRKICKNKATTLHYSSLRRSVVIKNDLDVDYYFNCYNIDNIVKNLCKKWLLLGGGCFLDYSPSYCGTIYITKTKKPSFYNHIHLFPISMHSYSWHDKKSRKYEVANFSESIDKSISKFMKLLSK